MLGEGHAAQAEPQPPEVLVLVVLDVVFMVCWNFVNSTIRRAAPGHVPVTCECDIVIYDSRAGASMKTAKLGVREYLQGQIW